MNKVVSSLSKDTLNLKKETSSGWTNIGNKQSIIKNYYLTNNNISVLDNINKISINKGIEKENISLYTFYQITKNLKQNINFSKNFTKLTITLYLLYLKTNIELFNNSLKNIYLTQDPIKKTLSNIIKFYKKEFNKNNEISFNNSILFYKKH